ncbi:hypothetical protein K4F52_001003 [Lecanicillium sp. MT-2017a]|nr:hypothetical protein K4F52_001003 [Lecanicillium sp. MT-2017a]
MKKFTKILPRRLQGRGGDDRRDATPGLSDARDHHQLTSRPRAAPSKRPTRTGQTRISILPPEEGVENGLNGDGGGTDLGGDTPKGQQNGQSNGLAHPQTTSHDMPIVCQHCAAIGFPRLFDWKPGDARPWISLTHVLADTSTCPYCTFFQAMIGHVPPTDASGGAESETPSVSESDAGNYPPSYTGTFTPYLRIRHAFERLGVSQKHELGRQVLFEVTTKSKALPRGYIVRCGEDEASLDGYLDAVPVTKEADEDDGESEAAVEVNLPAPCIRGRTAPPKLDPAVPKCWIEYCKANHGEMQCGAAATVVKGLKLVDITQKKVVSASDLDADFEYVTLSYAAGDPYTDTSDTLDTETGLPSDFPPLITDAISLTTSLGYRYIWIDRYCAPPPETTASGRQHLDALGTLLASSALTIIVAAGSGLADGIPGVSVPRQDQLSLANEAGLFTTSLVRPDAEVAASRWTTRAWTLQEGLLARRRLVLTPSQAYFQCGRLHCHESLALPLRHADGVPYGRVFPLDGVRGMDVRGFIGSYMPRALDGMECRLDACRAGLRAFAKREQRPVDSFLGLPLFEPEAFANVKVVSQTDRLAVGLSWFVSNRAGTTGPATLQPAAPSSSPSSSSPASSEPCSLDETLPFPSWTWLAWRIRPDSAAAHNPRCFRIHLANDADAAVAPLADGLCAPPGTEVSVGFADGLVVSWEIDGEAIARRTERIAFLRIRTFCFDVRVDVGEGDGLKIAEPDGGGVLDTPARDGIVSCVRSSGFALEGRKEVKLVAVLIAGKNWKRDVVGGGEGASGTGGGSEATALLCANRDWDDEKPLVRIGVFGLSYAEFVPQGDAGGDESESGESAILKGVVGADGKKGSIKTCMREVDLY